jgi:hypothetical protein
MTESDRNILKLFLGIFLFFLVISIISIFIGLFITFGITGILAFKYYRKSAIIPTKKLLKSSALIALIIAIVPTLLVVFFAITVPGFPNDIEIIIVMTFFIFIGMILVIFLIIVVLFFVAFGMAGVLAAVVRGNAPEILLHVSRISASRAVKKQKKKKITKLSTMDSIISWAFAIPDVLETKSLKINQGRPRNYFPWSNFYKAIWWQTLFGAVIIVYLCFNPLYVKSELDFQNLFGIASNITIMVPFMILPWFIFSRLDARIKGQVKDYELYRGIVYRMYQTFFTLGTIIIILRLGLERIDPEAILLALPAYYMIFMGTIALVTFIYHNYVENGMAWEVAKRYKQIKD